MRYTIRHFDLPLLTFEANMDSADTGLHFIKVYEENRSFLPLNLTVSEDGVERWLRHRTIPKNRAYVDALLSKVGLSLNRPLGIIAANKGLSLNDCFWVDPENCGEDRYQACQPGRQEGKRAGPLTGVYEGCKSKSIAESLAGVCGGRKGKSGTGSKNGCERHKRNSRVIC